MTTDEDCPICLRDFSGREQTKTTHCGHTFHLKCIQELRRHSGRGVLPKCPMCRENLLPVDTMSASQMRGANSSQRVGPMRVSSNNWDYHRNYNFTFNNAGGQMGPSMWEVLMIVIIAILIAMVPTYFIYSAEMDKSCFCQYDWAEEIEMGMRSKSIPGIFGYYERTIIRDTRCNSWC
jgi:hypothetical protein